mgnify:CR=1 FL=1
MAKITRPILKIRDLTLRDGQQSLFATRMNQATIDKLLPYYEDANFYIMEVWGGAVPDSVMRYLDESPWDRLRIVSKAMDSKSGHPKSLLSALSRGRNLFGYVPYPNSVLEGFYKEAIDNGLNVMRIFDALNDIDNVKESIRLINSLGGIADGAVCYTVDPKQEVKEEPSGFMGKLKSMFGSKPAEPEKIFTDNYFVEKAKAMEALGAKIITLKDMAGLVNPSRAASIISALKANVKVPVDFHTHCTPGYGLASALMAIINGVDILDTNIWWFGGGSAAPAIELIYIFCQRLGVEVEVNMVLEYMPPGTSAVLTSSLGLGKWKYASILWHVSSRPSSSPANAKLIAVSNRAAISAGRVSLRGSKSIGILSRLRSKSARALRALKSSLRMRPTASIFTSTSTPRR